MSTYQTAHEDRALIETFTQRIRAGISDWYGSSSSLKVNTPEVRRYTNSFLLRYQVATTKGDKGILLKIRRNPKVTSLTRAIHAHEIHANIPQEYETLRYVYERIGTGHAHFTAIRPLDYFEDHFAIVMEEFPSHSLRQLLQRQRSGDPAEMQMIAERAGEVLRFFHEHVYSTAHRRYFAEDILADAEGYALILEQSSRGRFRSQEILDALAQKLSGKEIRSIPYTSVHQDLTCDNVLFSDAGKVSLIDIKVKPAPIYADLGLLLIHPDTFRDQIFRNGAYFSQQYLKHYRDSILKGYFGASPIDELLVNIYSAIRVLDKWSMHEGLFHKYRGIKRVLTRPLAPLVTMYFHRLWKSYLQMFA